MKHFTITLLFTFFLLFCPQNVFPQAVRTQGSEFKLSIPLLSIKNSNIFMVLDTVLFYKNKCVFARKGAIQTNQIELFRLASDSNTLLIDYSGFSNYFGLDFLKPPFGCFFHKESLFFVYLGSAMGKIDTTEWLKNQFDSLFIKADSNYTLIYDMANFQYFYKAIFEWDELKIRFAKGNNNYKVISMETCIEKKKDLYIPPKHSKVKRK